MKRLFAALLLLPTLALGAANDLFVNQRDNTNSNTLTRTVTSPAADAILGYSFNGVVSANRVPMFWTLGPGLQLTGNVLSAPGAGAAPDWSMITGKPEFAAVATSGSYAALTGVPSTFAPSAHTHAAADVTTGVLALARLPSLPISQTTGLQTALDGKLAAPTGTAAQYLRGDGALATFPSIPAAQVQTDWNATTGLGVLLNKPTSFPPAAHNQAWSTITSTPNTLAGYGIQDGVSQSALTSALAVKFNTPTGTTAQYVRGDGSLATLPTAKRIEVYTGTTNAAGQITVTYSTPFTSVPVVQPPAPTLPSQVWTTISSTTTGFTLQLNQRNTVPLLGMEVLLGATVPVNGAAATVLVVSQ